MPCYDSINGACLRSLIRSYGPPLPINHDHAPLRPACDCGRDHGVAHRSSTLERGNVGFDPGTAVPVVYHATAAAGFLTTFDHLGRYIYQILTQIFTRC